MYGQDAILTALYYISIYMCVCVVGNWAAETIPGRK